MSSPLIVEHGDSHEHAKKRDLAYLLVGAAAVIVALAFLIWVVWQVVAGPKATPFDADGVRCYRAASELSCIKTAEPPR
jgi:hypothetical protein